MQASSGGEGGHQQQQQHSHGNGSAGAGGESMSRNGSLNGGYTASSPRTSEAAAGVSGGGNANAGGHKFKIRLGGNSLTSGRGTSVSSEGTNGPATPHAATPIAASTSRATSPAQVNGHTAEQYHAQQNGTALDSGVNDAVMKQEQPPSVLMDKKTSSQSGMKAMDEQAVHIEDEHAKQQREIQLQKDLAELPNVAHHSLVPLYELVRRLLARSYTDLQSIVEV